MTVFECLCWNSHQTSHTTSSLRSTLPAAHRILQILELREIKFSKAKTCLATKTSKCDRHCAKQTHNCLCKISTVKGPPVSKWSSKVTFWQKKHVISKTGLMFFNPPPPPSKPTNLWKAIPFVSKPLGRFWIEHLSVLFFFSPVLMENNLQKYDSRHETIFVRHEIYFQTYFWAFFWKWMKRSKYHSISSTRKKIRFYSAKI